MSNKTIKILLLISLAFNLAFLGAGVFRFVQMRRFGPIHKRIHNEKVENFLQQRKGDRIKAAREFHKVKDEFLRALANENIDEKELEVMMDSLITKQVLMEKEISRSFIELRKELSPEEARKIFSQFRVMMKPPERFRPPEHEQPGRWRDHKPKRENRKMEEER